MRERKRERARDEIEKKEREREREMNIDHMSAIFFNCLNLITGRVLCN